MKRQLVVVSVVLFLVSMNAHAKDKSNHAKAEAWAAKGLSPASVTLPGIHRAGKVSLAKPAAANVEQPKKGWLPRLTK
jgi:hypothetical protein